MGTRYLESSADHALQVCVACKQNKRKCDKISSGCTPCRRVGRHCVYSTESPRERELRRLRRRIAHLERDLPTDPDDDRNDDDNHSNDGSHNNENVYTATRPSPTTTAPEPIRSTSTLRASTSTDAILAASIDGFGDLDPFRHPQLRKSFVNRHVTTHALKLIGGMPTIQRSANMFFDSAHVWLPVISKSRFFESISNLSVEPSAETALLSLCIYLTIQLPEGNNAEHLRTSLYTIVKMYLTMLEACEIVSLSVVQSGLLVCLYELGHGFLNAAACSIVICSRIGCTMGLHNTCSSQCLPPQLCSASLDEARRTWWGVIILDRYVNLQTGCALFAAPAPSLDFFLPVDDDLGSNKSGEKEDSLRLSVSLDIQVCAFARSAQIAHLLGRVLCHIYEPTTNTRFNSEEKSALDCALQTFRGFLPQNTDDHTKHCAAIGMCHSALLLLHGCRIETDDSSASRPTGSLSVSAQAVVDIAYNYFYPMVNQNSLKLDALPPFMPSCIHQAAVVQIKLFDETGDAYYIQSYESMVNMLQTFSRRWKIAEQLLNKLEKRQ